MAPRVAGLDRPPPAAGMRFLVSHSQNLSRRFAVAGNWTPSGVAPKRPRGGAGGSCPSPLRAPVPTLGSSRRRLSTGSPHVIRLDGLQGLSKRSRDPAVSPSPLLSRTGAFLHGPPSLVSELASPCLRQTMTSIGGALIRARSFSGTHAQDLKLVVLLNASGHFLRSPLCSSHETVRTA